MSKRHLFLSFTRTVWELEAKRLKSSHVKGGLFFFGYMRQFTHDPNAVAKTIGAIEGHPEIVAAAQKTAKAQKILTDELRLAEQEGRVKYRWRRRTVDQFQRLNQLLTDNGLPALRAPTDEERKWHRWGAYQKKGYRDYQVFNPDGYSSILAAVLIQEQLTDLAKIVVG